MLATLDPQTDSAGFRTALGMFTTGVTLVTTDRPEGPVGIVANSFSSVSLDPPLVLWCPAKSSRRFDDFATAKHYAIHVLAADQKSVANAVSKSKTDLTLAEVRANALATFDCALHSSHDAGDHLIIVGEVTKCQHRAGKALIYQNGGYKDL